MKKRIQKFIALLGILLTVFCASAGSAGGASASEAAGTVPVQAASAGDTAAVIRLSAQAVTSSDLPAAAGSSQDWISTAFDAQLALKTTAFSPAPATENTAPAKTLFTKEDPYAYSDEEIRYIARVVYAEARGETFAGKVAVAAVVINRFESGCFGSTVKRVVFAKNQFAVSRRTNDECIMAVRAAINSRGVFPSDMYYFQVSKSKRWRSFEYYTRIGNHSFYCAS